MIIPGIIASANNRAGAAGGGALTTAGAILADLIAWWDFGENDTSTQFLDAHGNNDFDLINSKNTSQDSTASGKVGRASLWPNANSSDGGQIPRSNTTFDKGDVGFSFGGWFYFNELPSNDVSRFLLGRLGGTGANELCYGIQLRTLSAAQVPQVAVRNTADTASTVLNLGNLVTPINVSTWYHVVWAHDPTNNLLVGYVNTTKQTTAHSGGVQSAGTSNFSIGQGRRSDTTNWDTARTVGFRCDSVFFLNRLITDAEVSYLYNSGNGKDYAALLADA